MTAVTQLFLFEWTFVLFKCAKLNEAEIKLHLTFFSNTYLLDKFLEKEFLDLNKNENLSWEIESLKSHFHYNKSNIEFTEFANWISEKLLTKVFLDKVNRFVEIEQKLKLEPVFNERKKLSNKLSKLKYG